MIPLLLDEGLPRSAGERLRVEGMDVMHVVDVGLGGADDTAVLAAAVVQGRAVVTLDADMARLLHLTGARSPSVVHLRVQGSTATRPSVG